MHITELEITEIQRVMDVIWAAMRGASLDLPRHGETMIDTLPVVMALGGCMLGVLKLGHKEPLRYAQDVLAAIEPFIRQELRPSLLKAAK